ncbi:MAG: phosphatase PAP2 family protein [Verrucomicrobiales bacterium]|jgi:membrane-associated phospholipid phosphatase|nr:phosphatase PAP2 family protein [Verrucomicrobiales bacterium]
MMNCWSAADVWVFRWVNEGCACPALDWVLGFVGGTGAMHWLLVTLAVLLVTLGGFKGRVYVLLAVLCVAIGDPLVVNSIKRTAGRARPYAALEQVRRVSWQDGAPRVRWVSKETRKANSMPSAHVANSTALALAAALVFGWRRWRWLLLWPLLMMVSRVYTGDHFPADTVAGFLLGGGYTLIICRAADKVWRNYGRRLTPQLYDKHSTLLA